MIQPYEAHHGRTQVVILVKHDACDITRQFGMQKITRGTPYTLIRTENCFKMPSLKSKMDQQSTKRTFRGQSVEFKPESKHQRRVFNLCDNNTTTLLMVWRLMPA